MELKMKVERLRSILEKVVFSETTEKKYSGIRIKADDKVTFETNNTMISLKVEEAGEEGAIEILEKGDIILTAKHILDIVKKFPEETIHLKTEKNGIKISGNKVNVFLNGFNDYPKIPDAKIMDGTEIEMDSKTLKDALERLKGICKFSTARPILGGIFVEVLDDGKVRMTSSDGYRLGRGIIEADIKKVNAKSMVMPEKYASLFCKTCSGDGIVKIKFNKSFFEVDFDNVHSQCAQISGTFPDLTRVIPEEASMKLGLNSDDLLNVINRTTFIKTDNINIISLDINEKEFIARSSNKEIGQSVESVPFDSYNGNSIRFSVNGTFLKEAVKNLKSEKIVVGFNQKTKPFLITGENKNFLMMVAPVRTDEDY